MKEILQGLKDALAQEATYGWRLTLAHAKQVSVGMKDNVAGGAYAPPLLEDNTSLSYVIAWDEERVSRAQVGSAADLSPHELLKRARAQAHRDPDAAVFPPPAPIPEVQIHDPDSQRMVEHGSADLAAMLALAREVSHASGAELLSGRCFARERATLVETSGGFSGSARGTVCSYGFHFDGRYGSGRSTRKPWNAEEGRQRLGEAAGLAQLLEQAPATLPSGPGKVLFHPAVTQGLLSAFLLGNLAGSKVIYGLSAFAEKEFGLDRRVLREGFTVGVDPLRDGAVGSYPFSSEGVPSRPVSFVSDGRLITPSLDLKLARRCGRAPTSQVAAGDTLVLEDPLMLQRDEAFAELDSGLLVLSLLGLHTQDPASGCFSLVAAQALAHEGLQALGPCPTVISGRLLEALAGEDARLVRWPGEDWPGLLMTCQLLPRG